MHYYIATTKDGESKFIFKVSYGDMIRLHEPRDGPSWETEEISESQYESYSERGLDLLPEQPLTNEWSATVERTYR